MNGKPLWEKDLGDMKVKLGFGEGSTPALGKDRVVVQWDHEGESFLVALDKKTGQELWRQKREEETSWASPLLVEHAGKTQVVTSATKKVRSYDAKGGEPALGDPGHDDERDPHARARGRARLPHERLPRQRAPRGEARRGQGRHLRLARDRVEARPRHALRALAAALRRRALHPQGQQRPAHLPWTRKTGERLYGPERLEGVPNVYASPVGAGGRVYIPGREGATAVVERGRAFKLLATNTLEDGFDASPLAVGSELYLRGQKFLYRISE